MRWLARNSRQESSVRSAKRVLRSAIEPLEVRLMMDVSRALENAQISWWEADSSSAPEQIGPVLAQAVEAAVAGAVTAAGLPILNSLPGAPTAIFMDFDGDTSLGIQSYDEDGSYDTFNASEQSVITEAWRQMSQYFSMFNVNVTTIRPSVPMVYNIIGNNTGGSTGGYAYVGTFPNTTPQAFNVGSNARDRVTGIAHEAGHVFGLGHQSTYDLLGNKTAEYASESDPLHGPMMGVDYAGLVHKWFIGHPSGSASDLQDDVAYIAGKISSRGGGDGFRPDDYANATSSATPLLTTGLVQSISGVIERMTDVDAFSFTSVGGTLSILAAPDWPSPVDLKLMVFDSAGKLLAAQDSDVNAQQVVLNLPAGTYYATVQSHGNYGDLGSYELSVQTLPAGWADADLGLTGIAGSAQYDAASSTFTLTASGDDLWNESDAIHFAYQKLSGNGTIIARVLSISDTDSWAKSGLMIRESLAANAKSVAMLATPKGGPQMAWRTSTGGGTTGYWASAVNFSPIWLKLERVGTTFRGYRSTDGVNYTLWSSTTVSMNADVYIGLALTSHNQRKLNTSSFSNVSLIGNVGSPTPVYNSLPAPADLRVVPGTGTGLNVSWSPVAGATGYAVERSPDGVTFTRVATTAADSTDYSDNNLPGQLRYFYRVSALDASGASVPCDMVSMLNRPSAPASLTITSLNTTTLVLNWKDTSGETGYRIERSSDGGNFTVLGSVGKNVPSYTDRNLTISTGYYYRVIPTSALGDSPATTATRGMTRLAQVPSLAFDSVEANKIVFHWTDISGETSYRIDRSTDGKTFTRLTTLGANVTTYTDTTVQPLKEYYYRVVGVATGTESVTPPPLFAGTPATTPLPSPWTSQDVGAVDGRGSAGYSNGKFTIIGDGQDIWGNSDAFHFVYQPLVGNGEIVARITGQEETDGWAKNGVMIRESLNANSKHAMVVVTPTNGVSMQYRSSTGGSTNISGSATGAAPYWVKLVRNGNTLTGYASSDGSTWTTVASVTISMGSNIYIGLTSNSHTSTLLNTVTFDNVTVSNRAPTLATAATASPNPVTGTTATLSVLGADDHGEANLSYLWSITNMPAGVASPSFSPNGVNAAKNCTATFFGTGVYLLTVTISDAGGLTITSTVSVTVQQTLSAIQISPDSVTLDAEQTQQFTATFTDQFGHPMLNPPSVLWSVTSGGGAINANGLFTAPADSQTSIITAKSGQLSDTATVTTIRQAPPAPTDFAGGLMDDGSVVLGWTDNASWEDGYRIERSLNGGAFMLVGTTSADATEFVDSHPATGIALYRVTVFSGTAAASAQQYVVYLGGGNSDESWSVTLDTPGTNIALQLRDAAPITVEYAAVSMILAWGAGGSDQLLVDFANGSPLPVFGLAFTGGSDGAVGDALRIAGSPGNDSVTFTADQVNIGSGTIYFSGVEQRAVALGTGADTLNIIGTSVLFTENAAAGTERLTLNASNAALTFQTSQNLAALNLAGTSTATLAAGGGKTLVTDKLWLATGAKLDLVDNNLVVRASEATRAGVFSDILAWVRSARSSGSNLWKGNGITSSTARTAANTGLAVVLNDSGNGSLINAAQDANAILVKYTYLGDVNLDGSVNLNDYFIIDSGYLNQRSGFANGDVNYDGEINLNDYFLIDSAYLNQKTPLAATSLFNTTSKVTRSNTATQTKASKTKKAKIQAARLQVQKRKQPRA